MNPLIGDLMKSKLTGELYRVKRIKMQTVLLEGKNIPDKAWLGDKESLELFYEKAENQEG
jgi:hypothetical protein